MLGVPFGPDDTVQRGYRIARRGGHRSTTLADGAEGLLLVDDEAVGEGWRIVFTAGARGEQPLFEGRVRETVFVDRGVLEVEVAGRRELLHEGDTLVVPRASIGSWRNPGPNDAVVTWLVLS